MWVGARFGRGRDSPAVFGGDAAVAGGSGGPDGALAIGGDACAVPVEIACSVAGPVGASGGAAEDAGVTVSKVGGVDVLAKAAQARTAHTPATTNPAAIRRGDHRAAPLVSAASIVEADPIVAASRARAALRGASPAGGASDATDEPCPSASSTSDAERKRFERSRVRQRSTTLTIEAGHDGARVASETGSLEQMRTMICS